MYMSIFMYVQLPIIHSSVHMGKKSNLEVKSKKKVSVLISFMHTYKLEYKDC